MNKRRQGELFIKNKHIIQQKTAIENALKEKEFLIKEIHHRVKNNLQIISSMLSLQSDVIESKEAKEILQESRLRINSMSLIHQKLYQGEQLASVEMKDYFETMGQAMLQSFGAAGEQIALKVDMTTIDLDVDTAIHIGLIFSRQCPGTDRQFSIKIR